ncbi:hypothetical protein CMK14_00975 [Candidatus Poribacteria bacterium]|nr:hypothetical protein [Candidatus Poribacteria bacterium]
MGPFFSSQLAPSQLAHSVELNAFYIDVHEVTVVAFRYFVEDSDYNFSRWGQANQFSTTDQHPMIYVTWHDAVAYTQ